VEIERQRQEQRRIASERQQQREPQHNLKLLKQWQEAAIALGKSAEYVERILLVTADYQCGLPLSDQAIAARQKNLAANPQQKMQLEQQELKQTQDQERERKKQERGRGFSR